MERGTAQRTRNRGRRPLHEKYGCLVGTGPDRINCSVSKVAESTGVSSDQVGDIVKPGWVGARSNRPTVKRPLGVRERLVGEQTISRATPRRILDERKYRVIVK